LSLLYSGRAKVAPIAIARSREDFMMRALRQPYVVVVVERGWLSTFDLRRLALRRVFRATPKVVLVLRRDEAPTPFERMRYDSIVVARGAFATSAHDLQELVGCVPLARVTLPSVRANAAPVAAASAA
jgi:hypothetical protein